MTYIIVLNAHGLVTLDGPDNFDVEKEYKEWTSSFEQRVGPEPNIVAYGSHTIWLLKHMEVLKEFQQEYSCTGDFQTLFVEHLIQRYGFQRREYRAVRLV